jgi:hypothetical protein
VRNTPIKAVPVAVVEVSRPESAVIVVGTDHRLAGPEPLAAMLMAVEARKRNDDNSTTTPKETTLERVQRGTRRR